MRLFTFLKGEKSKEELAREAQWITELEHQKRMLEAYPQALLSERIFKLQLYRARMSNSLGRSEDAVQGWNRGQELINHWLVEEKKLKLGDIQTLNEILTQRQKQSHSQNQSQNQNQDQDQTQRPQSSGPGWRQVDIYTTQVRHLSPHDLEGMMRALWDFLQETVKKDHPLYSACVCRYWVLSIHPFSEANGRTSQLLADYFLLKAGFPPQSFASKFEGNLIGDPEKKTFIHSHEAFKRFCQTIRNSFQILLH